MRRLAQGQLDSPGIELATFRLPANPLYLLSQTSPLKAARGSGDGVTASLRDGRTWRRQMATPPERHAANPRSNANWREESLESGFPLR